MYAFIYGRLVREVCLWSASHGCLCVYDELRVYAVCVVLITYYYYATANAGAAGPVQNTNTSAVRNSLRLVCLHCCRRVLLLFLRD